MAEESLGFDRRWIVGIDPGKQGAIAAVGKQGVVAKMAMPLADGDLDLQAICKFFSDNRRRIGLVVLEKVHAMPKQGVVSMFTFGRGFGNLEGIVTAFNIPLKLIQPRAWQKVMHNGYVGEPKQRSISAVQYMFPDLDLRKSSRAKKPHDGIADAILLAAFGVVDEMAFSFWRRVQRGEWDEKASGA